MLLWRLVAVLGAGALERTTSWGVTAASSDAGSPSARAVDHNATRLGQSHLRVLLDGACDCGWIEDTWDRGCGFDDQTGCWEECCSWKCSCDWAEVTCGADDGTACWGHCCGGPECDCGWAVEAGCGESDNSPCWHHCCDPAAGLAPLDARQAADEADSLPPQPHGPPVISSAPRPPAAPAAGGEGWNVDKGGQEGCDCSCIKDGSKIADPDCSGDVPSVGCQMHCAREAKVPAVLAGGGRPLEPRAWFQPWPEEEGIPMPPNFAGAFFNHTLWGGAGGGPPGGSGSGGGPHAGVGRGSSLLVGEDSHGGNLLVGDGSLGGSLLLGGGDELLVGGDSRGGGPLAAEGGSHGGDGGHAWAGSIVPLCFSPEVSLRTQRVVRAAAERFSAMIPCVVFREVPRLPRKLGEPAQCSQAPAILITSKCAGPQDCTCGPLESGEPTAERMRVLNLVDPDCLHRGLVLHELGHAIGTSRNRSGDLGSHFGVSLEAPSSVFLHRGAGILSGLSTLIWEWVWTPAALNSLDIDQLKQMYEMEEVGSHEPLHGGPRCLDIPRDGVDICVQLSDENCEASEDVYRRCCVCGGGLKIQCPLGTAAGPFPGPEVLAEDAAPARRKAPVELAQVPAVPWRARRAAAGGPALPLVGAGCAAASLAGLALAARHARRRTSRAVAPEDPDCCGGAAAGSLLGHLWFWRRLSAL